MVTLTIDNKQVSVPAGTTILDAARAVDIHIPTLCYLREINEEILPKMAKRLHVKGGYYELCLRMLEEKAEGLGITPFVIRTEEELLREIAQMKKKPMRALTG